MTMLSTNSPNRPRMAAHQHRVLIYTTCYNVIDGVTLTIRKLEQEILAAGHSVCILTTLSGDPANTDLDGPHPNRQVVFMDNGIEIPFMREAHNPEITYQVGFALSQNVKNIIQDFEPSIIHLTCPDCSAMHLIQYARDKEIPIMGTYHSQIPEYMDHHPGVLWLKPILAAFFRHQYNFLQALYVPTPFMQQYLIDTYKMDRVTTLGIWGRGVDVQQFHPRHGSLKFRASLGLSEDTVVICWVGRLVLEKRVDIFCNVVRRLHAAGHTNFHALVIGAGNLEDEIKTLPQTTFCGWMTPDQLSVAYASCNIFLFPSSVETFGNVTLEAAASGLPVVVEAGCSGHLVQTNADGVSNGFACPAGDEDAFYEATLALVTNEKLRYNCSHAGRQLAETLEKSAVVRAMLDHYSTVTDQFYTEYGGHHANRDRVYRKRPGSFVAGSIVRPTLLVIVEALFLVLFQVIWNMINMFFYMQEAFASMTGGMLVADAGGAEDVDTTTSDTSATTGTTNSPRQQEEPEGIVFGLDGPDATELIDVEMDDAESQRLLRSSSSALSDDDDNNDDETSTRADDNDQAPPRKAIGDGPIALALSHSLVRSLQFMLRMESHLRNGEILCCCNPVAAMIRAPKRKNSGELLLVHRQESTIEDMDDDGDSASVVELAAPAGFEPGHRLRRQRGDPLMAADNTTASILMV